jgi:arylamine N-acetyltransferase
MVILAIIQGKTYHIDVGFANLGAPSPLLLEENVQVKCVPGLEAQLIKRVIPDNVTDQKLWILENRGSHSKQWRSGYCFGEMEFLPQDFYTLNFRTMTDPASWFTKTFILTRILLKEGTEDEETEIQGTITITNDILQRRIDGGEAEVMMTFKSEQERIEALEKHFYVKLTDDEVKAISGSAAEIKSIDNSTT